MIIEDEYICIKTLVIMSDSEYGYHVYANHGYKNISIDFHTDSEDLILIMKEINNIFENIESKEVKNDNNKIYKKNN